MRQIEHLAVALLLAGAAMSGAPAAACTVSATGVAFGTYDILSPAPDDSTGSIEVACHPSIHGPIVALGSGGSGSFAPREMTGIGGDLPYNLYTSAARTIVWGDGTAGTSTVTLIGGIVNSGTRRFMRPVHGRIPPQQPVGFGAYSDTLFVTVSF